MYSTYPTISKLTPVVLQAFCEQNGITEEEVRLGTLKTVECSLGNFLENALLDLHDDDRAALEHIHRQVRLAIGGE